MTSAFASSAAPDFDLIRTVEIAQENNFKSIQLYINEKYIDVEYLNDLIIAINKSDLESVVIHLPNLNDLTPGIINAVENIVNLKSPHLKVVGLIHYEDEIPIKTIHVPEGVNGVAVKPLFMNDIPKIPGLIIGVENSKTKVFDPKHVMRAFHMATLHHIPFVFDIGRIMYPRKKGGEIEQETINEIYDFITILISQLDPSQDIIHLSGKTQFGDFRSFSCALGAEDDITIPLIPVIKEFSDRGGIVVFEHEDLIQALESKKALEG
ncbi:MAG: hypothetical protein ABI721_01245 [Candidatus Dojkabacteria bacterium]